MPHRTLRRSGLTRVSLRLVILLILAAVALAATGCGDDDGLSPIHPERGIAGTWVRYQPTPPYTRDLDAARMMAITWRDTLELGPELRGRWSHEVTTIEGSTVRVDSPVVLLVEPPFLFLDFGCLSCQGPVGDRARIAGPPAAPRRESRVAGPVYGIVRDGRDHLELRSLFQPADIQFFRRAGATTGPE